MPLACLPATDLCNGVDHGCEFKCVSTEGSYHCMCPEGQQLQADGKTCSSEYRDTALSILFVWAYLKLGWESKCDFELGWRAESQMGLGEHPCCCRDGCRCVFSEEATGALRKGSGRGRPRRDFQGMLGWQWRFLS